MGIINLITSMSATWACDKAISVLAKSYTYSGPISKTLDKILVPIGTFCISATVGDYVGDHIEEKVKIMHNNSELMKLIEENTILKAKLEEKKAEVHHNVFEKEGANGES